MRRGRKANWLNQCRRFLGASGSTKVNYEFKKTLEKNQKVCFVFEGNPHEKIIKDNVSKAKQIVDSQGEMPNYIVSYDKQEGFCVHQGKAIEKTVDKW